MIKLFNTLGRQLQDFEPLDKPKVKIYTCGPTVYDYQHIGNYSGYIYWDVLIRLLKHRGYDVKRVMNLTDVGHLVSDADEGEDKLEKSARREGKTAREVADFYTEDFLKNAKSLNLLPADTLAKATDYIAQQINIVQRLLDKGFAYQTEQAIYFDVTKLADYGKLTGQKLSEKEVGARAEVVTDSAKHHPQDFALWFFTVGRFAEHEMRWDSPWGSGFPGWHLECSAIIHSTLGEPIDIHTGGVDHIGTHHTNEIAQSEAAFDTDLAKYWLHNNHMMVAGQKISKSLRNGYTLKDLEEKGFSAMDFRLLVLESHYRSQSNFDWDILTAAQNRLKRIYAAAELRHQLTSQSEYAQSTSIERSVKDIEEAISDDLNTPKVLAAIDSELDQFEDEGVMTGSKDNFERWLEFVDDLLGLKILESTPDISDTQKSLIKERESARETQDWAKADQLRRQLSEQGIELNDTERGSIWRRA
ncbi:MAG TPA: cysteine--tRNA ligase [Candidatus Saccharimonadales bacterium]|nr:cysteine--tRNA ligase [Candidatus Saccharimonadales bacterium]